MERRLQLLLLTKDFPAPGRPNQGIFNAEMVRGLLTAHHVEVVCPVPWTKVRRQPPPDTVPAGCTVHYPTFWYVPGMLHTWHGSLLWWSVRRTVRNILATRRPDAVLAYWAHPDGEVAVRVARQIGVPALVMVGGSDVLLLTSRRRRRRCILRVLQQADAVITVSQHLRETLVALGMDAAPIHVVQRGIDTRRFAPGSRSVARQRLGIASSQRMLLWVGRMVPVKGLDVLLQACHLLREDSYHLYLVGDGPLRPSLERSCHKLGLAARISLVGPVAHDQLADWYRAADLVVLPSHSEGIPNVLREAQACGTPFVASRVGGIPELADERNSRLVPPGDATALAQAIREMLAVGSSSLANAARPVSLEEAADALGAVIQSLLARHHHSASVTTVSGRPSLVSRDSAGNGRQGEQVPCLAR